jgi:hypothetical protein
MNLKYIGLVCLILILVIIGTVFIFEEKQKIQEWKTYWIKTIGGEKLDYAPSVLVEDDGYVFIGYSESYGAGSFDFMIVKVGKNGDILWNNVIGTREDDRPYAIAKTNDGGYIVIGDTRPPGDGLGISADILAVKLNSMGGLEWGKTIDNARKDDRAFSVVSQRDGYLIFGSTGDPLSDASALLVMIDDNGNLVPGKTIMLNNLKERKVMMGYGVAKTSDGGYVLVGLTPGQMQDIFIVKLKADMTLDWAKIIGGEGIEGPNWDGIRQASDGSYICAAITYSSGDSEGDMLLVKLDSDGNPVWNKVIARLGKDAGWTMNEVSDGYIAGGTLFHSANKGDIALIKLDRDGDVKWGRMIDSGGMDEIEEVKPISGGYVMAGFFDGDFFMGKVDENGLITNCGNVKEITFYTLSEKDLGRLGEFEAIITPLNLRVSNFSPTIGKVTPIVSAAEVSESKNVNLNLITICSG